MTAAVLPYARAALAAVAGARQAVDELTGLLRGHVTIGTLTSISSHEVDLPGLLAGFHDEHPAVDVTLSVANSDDLVDALRTGRLDLAVIGLGATTPAGIGTHVLAREPLVAVVSLRDSLAATTTITVAALADRTLISLPRGTGLRSALEQACTAAGFALYVAFEAGDPRLLAELAARDLGVAVVPQSVADSRHEQLHTLSITEPELMRSAPQRGRSSPEPALSHPDQPPNSEPSNSEEQAPILWCAASPSLPGACRLSPSRWPGSTPTTRYRKFRRKLRR